MNAYIGPRLSEARAGDIVSSISLCSPGVHNVEDGCWHQAKVESVFADGSVWVTRTSTRRGGPDRTFARRLAEYRVVTGGSSGGHA